MTLRSRRVEVDWEHSTLRLEALKRSSSSVESSIGENEAGELSRRELSRQLSHLSDKSFLSDLFEAPEHEQMAPSTWLVINY